MKTRRERIVLLAGSLYDEMYLPETATGRILRRGLESGVAKGGEGGSTEWQPCPDCGHTETPGVVTDRFRRSLPCVTCGGQLEEREGGKLLVRSRRGSGRVKVDRYTGAQVSTAEQSAPARLRRCPICRDDGRERVRCSMCRGEGWLPVTPLALKVADGADDDDGLAGLDPWTRSMILRNRSGSYHEFELALAEMARRSLHRWRVFCAVHVSFTRRTDELREVERGWLEEALTDLERLMPAVIRVPGRLLAARPKQLAPRGRHVPEHSREERDREIRERHANGEQPSEIADDLELSVRTVQRVLYGDAA